MAACPSCGFEYEGSFKFCPECAAPLGVSVRQVAEERKVVSVLFCDLAGFTASSEAADPEDVARMLAAYFKVARAQIEGHGGVVEKFIGVAVVGVFGVPAAHEDDPERAVRAGLRIVEDAEDLRGVGGVPLSLRVGVNTGEALVRLDVVPGSGEGFLAGDAINTAARIQSVAPVNGVAVGVSTFEATGVVFDYTELEPATLKGKSEPVRVFQALASRARLGTDLTRTHGSPFVGREIDLALLKGLFGKTVAASSVQLVTVVGEPGLGKSRIVAELLGHAQTQAPLLTWRQGRCLPYGDGITFWALGEIVKAQAGILESDGVEAASAKLSEAVPDGVDREWMAQRLLPLVGVDASGSAGREELFTAWRGFLETVAERSPTVLVFEDIHWADDALLAFLEHLADRAEGVSLLVVCTARPELYERHVTFAAGLHNANRINLAPLSDEETARLVSATLDATVLPDELRAPIVERAEGNPLYAEEFIRLLQDQGLLTRQDDGWVLREGAEVPLPGSIQALIAARLDTLPAERKALLADAAVVGKVFWAGAVAQMGDRDLDEVIDTLRELGRKELVRPTRRSSMEGEAEYAFWHVLTRDVAYNQLPRAARAARHVAAATWLEAKAGDRVEDISEVLAHHYTTALDLTRAAGHPDQATQLEAPALRFLTLAGEKALGLDGAAAVANFERALALTPAGHPERAAALARFGEAALQAGRYAEARDALEEAISVFQATGEVRAAALAMGTLGRAFYPLGDSRWAELPTEMVALLEPLPPGPELVSAFTELGRAEFIAMNKLDAAVHYTGRALELAEELGLPSPARTLGYHGCARAWLGDIGGIDEMRQAIALAVEAGQGHEALIHQANLAFALANFEGPGAGLQVTRAAIVFGQARGMDIDWLTSLQLRLLFDVGEFDEALTVAAGIVESSPTEAAAELILARATQARILILRGHAAQVADQLDWLETASRETGGWGFMFAGLSSAAQARLALGQADIAAALLRELCDLPNANENTDPALMRVALATGDRQLVERFFEHSEPRAPASEHAVVAALAVLAEANGDHQAAANGYADAAHRWEAFGGVPEQAFALLGQGRCLLVQRHPKEANLPLLQAREIFQKLQAAPALAETDLLLQQATALSS